MTQNRTGPFSSIKAGSCAIIGLTAWYAASRCDPLMSVHVHHFVRHEALEVERNTHTISRERSASDSAKSRSRSFLAASSKITCSLLPGAHWTVRTVAAVSRMDPPIG